MEKPDIPRLALESFAHFNYKVPLLQVQHYPVNAAYFTIENRERYPVSDYISPNRRQFYKIFHMTSGTGVLTIGLHQYNMGPGDIAFLHPDEIMSWQTTSEETGGHFCLIHPAYFGQEAAHVMQLFRQYPYFQPARAVIHLTAGQSDTINGFFEQMLREERGQNADKKQAILLHLQMLLLEAGRAGSHLANAQPSENYGYIHRFLTLLESAFQVKDPGTAVHLKTAAEFAGQLNVHPNYLNALVKSHTGKTVREHIQDRLLYEAQSLLVQTDWDINTISYGLGFSGHAAFTAFFTRKAQVSPTVFRKNTAAPAHL